MWGGGRSLLCFRRLEPLSSDRLPLAPAAPFVGNHEGEVSMALRSMTVHRYEEIRRRLAEGRSLREIARALGCSRRTVREVRDGERLSPDAPKSSLDPLWMAQLDWPTIIHDLGLGHPLKFLCAYFAQGRPAIHGKAVHGFTPCRSIARDAGRV
jgi:transcriptional regulator with XRE-family HTH domain